MRKSLALGLLPLSLLLASCSGGQQASPASPSTTVLEKISIGTGLSPETSQAAYIYAAVLADAGYQVEVKETSQGRQAYLEDLGIDLASNQLPVSADPSQVKLDLVPALSGDLLLDITQMGTVSPSQLEEERQAAEASTSASVGASNSPSPSSSASASASTSPLNLRGISSSDLIQTLDRALPDSVEVLDPSQASDRYGYAMTRAKAQELKITSMSDLRDKCSQLTLLAPQGYGLSPSGPASLTSNYACTPGTTREVADRDTALDTLVKGQSDLVYLFSASPQISQANLLFLEDPENTQLTQNILPLTRAKALPQEVKDLINKASADLSSDQLRRLNSLTSGDSAISQEDAAVFWLHQMRG